MVGQAKVGFSTFALKDKVMSLFCPCHDKEIHTVPRLLLLSWGCFFLHPGDTGPAGLETQSVATRVGGVAHGNFWVD